ncbi:uncharacterized protein LOC109532431 [Hippocampus comes]|uniref:uncharacterized protein LOC109532431 n=1 Tax=Hippocampus comes TaxID=109280 RepID=UPI00094E10BF|nr:PREDICTED: uncharacterized protein LOC109532431 [Hippocampus comes]
MCKVRLLRTLVKQRLNVAVEEIFELFERTIAEFEEELCRGKRGNEQRQGELLLDVVLKPHEADVQQVLLESQEEDEEEVPSEQQEKPVEASHVKEEEGVWRSHCGEQLQELGEEDVDTLPWTGVHVKGEGAEDVQPALVECEEDARECSSGVRQEPKHPDVKEEHTWIGQDRARLHGLEDTNVITFTLTGVHVKNEEEDAGRPSQRHRGPSEKFSQHVTTEADGGHSDDLRSQPGNFASLCDMNSMSRCRDADHSDDTAEALETNDQSKGMTSKGAEIARRYRERRDADPDRRRKYLEKERDKWKKQRETGKKKSVHELSELEKWAIRKKWREAKSQARARNRASALLQSETPPNSPATAKFPENHHEPFSTLSQTWFL